MSGKNNELPQSDDFNFSENDLAVDALIEGAKKLAKKNKSNPRDILLSQQAEIIRKNQEDKDSWLKWIKIALSIVDKET